jgi:hypothetical protein
MPTYVSHQVVEIAFASLSTETRLQMAKEMQQAINDTAVEYHRQTDREIAVVLYDEICAIRLVLDKVKEAQHVYDDLNGQDRSDFGPNG